MKRCMTLTDCSYKRDCLLANLPVSHSSGAFQPRNTGEFCDNYLPVTPEEEEAWGALSDKTGALE